MVRLLWTLQEPYYAFITTPRLTERIRFTFIDTILNFSLRMLYIFPLINKMDFLVNLTSWTTLFNFFSLSPSAITLNITRTSHVSKLCPRYIPSLKGLPWEANSIENSYKNFWCHSLCNPFRTCTHTSLISMLRNNRWKTVGVWIVALCNWDFSTFFVWRTYATGSYIFLCTKLHLFPISKTKPVENFFCEKLSDIES